MTNPDWLNEESELLAHVEKPDWEQIADRYHGEWLTVLFRAWKWEDRFYRACYVIGALCAVIVGPAVVLLGACRV